MKISHIAIWTADLETLREFYITYFEGRSGEKYTNPRKGFQSYFIYFGEEKTPLWKSCKEQTSPGYMFPKNTSASLTSHSPQAVKRK